MPCLNNSLSKDFFIPRNILHILISNVYRVMPCLPIQCPKISLSYGIYSKFISTVYRFKVISTTKLLHYFNKYPCTVCFEDKRIKQTNVPPICKTRERIYIIKLFDILPFDRVTADGKASSLKVVADVFNQVWRVIQHLYLCVLMWRRN